MEKATANGQLCTEVNQQATYLLESGELSDCTFLIETESHQVVVSAHKLILAMASPVFKAMFYGGMAGNKDAVPIVDVDPDVFKTLLKYIYTGDININSSDEACNLCYAAKKYMMEHIVKVCLSYLWENLNPENACQLYEFSKLFEAKALMQKCTKIISTNTKQILNHKSFEDVELSTVVTIFSLDNLNIDSELDLVDALIQYAKAQRKRITKSRESMPSKCKMLDNESSSSPEPSASENKVSVKSCAGNGLDIVTEPQKPSDGVDQLIPALTDLNFDIKDKEQIRGAIEKIRFLALTAAEFAEYSARYKLLTDLESYAVLLNIVSEKSGVPMPAGLSTCRTRRHVMIENGQQVNNESRNCGTFRYTVQNIRNLKEPAVSPPCYVRNLRWRLKVLPTSESSDSQHKDLSFYLECNWDSASCDWFCKAKYELKLISHDSTSSGASSGSITHVFTSESSSDDVSISWDEMLAADNGFIKNGAIIVEVNINAGVDPSKT